MPGGLLAGRGAGRAGCLPGGVERVGGLGRQLGTAARNVAEIMLTPFTWLVILAM